MSKVIFFILLITLINSKVDDLNGLLHFIEVDLNKTFADPDSLNSIVLKKVDSISSDPETLYFSLNFESKGKIQLTLPIDATVYILKLRSTSNR
jgi:hypothetical protein